MVVAQHRRIRFRAGLLWCVTTAAVVGVALITLPTIATGRGLLGPSTTFTDLLVAGCSAAMLVGTTCLWALTTDVVLGVVRAGGCVVVRRPGRVRLLLLAGCGAVALSATAGPATADDRGPVAPPSLAGLPLPDRATGDGPPRDRPDRRELPVRPDLPDRLDRPDLPDLPDLPDRPDLDAPSTVRVRPGDSLWTIAEERLGPGVATADVADYWRRIYDRNADLIGPDPALILPGQLLAMPPTS